MRGPAFIACARGDELLQTRSQEIHEERHEHAPGEHGSRELQGGEFRSDDVADAEIRRAYGGSGEGRDAAGLDDVGRASRAEADGTGSGLSDVDEEFFFDGEQLHRAEELDDRADADVPEEIAGGFGSALSGLVDFGCGDGFGERQRGVFDHDAADEGDEQDAEDAADDHHRGGLPVGVREVELRPGPGDDEGGDGENRTGGNGFADGARGTREILFEDGTFPDAQDGHADDGGRIRGGDGDARAQAQVGVGSAQDHAHDEAENHGPGRKFRHLCIFGNKRTVFARVGRAHRPKINIPAERYNEAA